LNVLGSNRLLTAHKASQTDKQIRNLRITLAVIIAKLKLNNSGQEDGKPWFVSSDGLVKYIQALISHAMQGNDRIEIPEFYYDRKTLADYNRLKHLLSTALTELQCQSGNMNAAEVAAIYKFLVNGLRNLD
jgi:hypothetical protein